MKKIFMTFVCLLGVLGANAQTAKIALMHHGNATMFDSDELKSALGAAVDGDTLYLNEGTFTAGLDITKKVTLIGAGESTRLTGDINIAIPGTPTLTAHLLDAIYMTDGSITVKQAVNGLKIRKCKFRGMYFDADVAGSSLVDRCWSFMSDNKGIVTLSEHTKDLSFVNCKIQELRGPAPTASSVTFQNCNIYQLNAPEGSQAVLATFVNSIITRFYNYYDPNATYINCLWYTGGNAWEGSLKTNCWRDTDCYIESSTVETNWKSSTIKSKGYIGTDGEVVGIYGGIPFTLVPSTPRITEGTVKVDTDKRQLNVNLKVSAN